MPRKKFIALPEDIYSKELIKEMKLYIELTDTEREIIGTRAKKAGLSVSEYAKRCLLNGGIYLLDIDEMLPVLDRCSDTVIAMRKLGRSIDRFADERSLLNSEENAKLIKMGKEIIAESEKLRNTVSCSMFSKRKVE